MERTMRRTHADTVSVEEIEKQRSLIQQVGETLDIGDDVTAALIANQIQVNRLETMQQKTLAEMERQWEVQQRDQSDVIGDFPVEMSHTITSNTPRTNPNEVTREPNSGDPYRVIAVTLGWPDGANNSAGVQIRTGDGLVLIPRNPQDDFIGFNDFSETFPVNYDFSGGEKLIARTVNLDSNNDHFVNIVPHVKELESEPEDEGGDMTNGAEQ